MLTLRELRSKLDDTDLRTRIARAAQQYMATKGYPDVRPLGTLSVEGGVYFYYVLPVETWCDLLELEVIEEPDDELGRDFVCLVTTYRKRVT